MSDAANTRETAGAMAEAAREWLDTLDPGQREAAVGHAPAGDGDTDAERRRWFYTPTDHGGLTFHEQLPPQQRAAMKLVGTGLSRAAYVTVATVMGLENVLDHTEGFVTLFDRTRGRDPQMYYLRVFGEPGAEGTWAWRFGGHHVSVNMLVVDGEVVASTPCFLGADPATSELLGEATLRPLGRVEDLARDLVRSLPGELRDRAVLLDKAPPDLVAANRTDPQDGDDWIPLAGIWRDRFANDAEQGRLEAMSETIEERAAFTGDDVAAVRLGRTPKGVPASDLDGGQREQLRALLATYLRRVPDALSPIARYDDDAALDRVHVAWAGSLADGAPNYYRLQGPRLLVEWDNTQRDANHAHSVWRDPSADFGLDVLGAHRAARHLS
ncbi:MULTISPECIES: DUF3500 domain-containing protein [unclassified Pseudonocardia]|uniref:DUF3500 domain-containing protein n=1 Tax=unclassified Pseudonocardia TaxID=2619320 RepID=UPI00094AA514|nr:MULTISPECIES: DUF3500 domain-containing protein [unclassified Pseudonocardia]OLL92888.1 hypothetical protein Ae356Ps1_2785c [Pseudonocardia sp. Ae356_Ps1]